MAVKKSVRRGASATRQSAQGRTIPGWLWLSVGIVIGVLATLLVHLVLDFSVNTHTVANNTGTGELVGKQKLSPAKKPVFDFYTLLPESEVMITNESGHGSAVLSKNEQSATTQAPATRQVTVAVEARPGRHYLLQADSFRNPDDADRLQAQLLLWGLNARVERVVVKGGDVWHRVQLGPFTEQGPMNEARRVLTEHKIDSLMLQLK